MAKTLIKAQNNDIYFFEIIDNKLIINDNYKGLLIFNNEFELLKRIKICDNLIIESSFKTEKGILLYCYENESIVSIDLNTYQKKIILLKEYENLRLSPIFAWNQNEVILLDYHRNVFELDLDGGELNRIQLEPDLNRLLKMDYQKIADWVIYKYFPMEKRIIAEIRPNHLTIVECKQAVQCIFNFYPEEGTHDFELYQNYLVEIGEGRVVVTDITKNIRKYFLPEDGYYFLRGKIMQEGETVQLFLLCGNKKNELDNQIEKYKL